MTKRILDIDPLSRETTIHHYDDMEKKTYIEVVQDIEPFLERNKKLQLTPEYQARGKKQDFMHIATIPNNVIIILKEKHGVDVFNKDDLPKLEKLLQSSEFKYLRTVDRI